MTGIGDASDMALIVAAVCAMIPATIAAVASLRSAKHAGQARLEAHAANDAVNNKAEGEPSIYELARVAAANARDAVRRVSELERLPAQLAEIGEVARRASDLAEQNNTLVTALLDELTDQEPCHGSHGSHGYDNTSRRVLPKRPRRWWW